MAHSNPRKSQLLPEKYPKDIHRSIAKKRAKTGQKRAFSRAGVMSKVFVVKLFELRSPSLAGRETQPATRELMKNSPQCGPVCRICGGIVSGIRYDIYSIYIYIYYTYIHVIALESELPKILNS